MQAEIVVIGTELLLGLRNNASTGPLADGV